MEATRDEKAPKDSAETPRKSIHWNELPQRYPLLWFATWLLGGGQTGLLLLDISQAAIWGLLVLAAALSGITYFRHWPLNQWLASVAVALGLWISLWNAAATGDSLSGFATRKAQPIAVRAVIDSAAVWSPNPNHRPEDPNSESWTTQWSVRVSDVKHGQHWEPATVHSTLRVDGRVTEFLPGDVLEIYGSYRKIMPPTNPGGFDFAERQRFENRFVYLAADNASQLKRIARKPYSLARIRAQAVQFVDGNIRRWVSEAHAPMAAALTFGQRQQVDWEDREELMATGTLHLLAISGMHVEIVAASLGLLCWCFTKRSWVRFLIVVSMCVLYAGLADGKPPVVRAVVMVASFEFARWQGRKARLANLLGCAAIVLFVIQARHLQNTGVHLSFLAVATIGVFVVGRQPERETAWQRFMQESSGAWTRMGKLCLNTVVQMLKLSFWVWLVTAPMVWYHFNVIAPIAIGLNVLISIPLMFGLLGGLATGLLGWIAPLGWVAGQICSINLGLIDTLISISAELAGGHTWLPAPSLAWLAVFYGVLIAWLILWHDGKRMWLAVCLSIWLGAGMVWFSGNRELARRSESTQQLSVTFLDVGHGTSVVIQFPNDQIWLYDAGHLGDADRSHQSISRALWQKGVSRIDRIILSHADSDHYNAVSGLVDRFHIRQVCSTDQFWKSMDRPLLLLHDKLHARSMVMDVWQAGEMGEEAEVAWTVLHPAPEHKYESDNASSLCLLLEFAGQRVLLPGDLDGTGLFSLTHTPPRPCHILMAPHHGSLSHDPSSILEWCRPDVVIISGNHRAVRPAVLEEYAAAQTLVTHRDHAVEVQIDQVGKTTVKCWQADRWVDTPSSW